MFHYRDLNQLSRTFIPLLGVLVICSTASAQLLPFGSFGRQDSPAEELEEVPAIPLRSDKRTPEVLMAPREVRSKVPSPTYAEAGETLDTPDPSNDGTELITERYQDGKVKIQRYVKQDSSRNYVNHGPWLAYNPKGSIVAQGEFFEGKLHGKWMRHITYLGLDPGFQAPFVSQAEFSEGDLDGTWTILDSAQRLVASWEFKAGELHGKTAAWYPNGQQKSEMTFTNGQPDGEALLYHQSGKITRRDYYRDGKQLVPVVHRYEDRKKETEGWILRSNFVFTTNFDWWNGIAEIHREQASGEDQKIGKWVQWHPNGQLKYVGHFDAGTPTGKHMWWHENGQRQLAGEFETGLREGLWTRWYSSGQKYEEGEYLAGAKFGEWTTWDEAGQIASIRDGDTLDRNVRAPSNTPQSHRVSFPRVGNEP